MGKGMWEKWLVKAKLRPRAAELKDLHSRVSLRTLYENSKMEIMHINLPMILALSALCLQHFSLLNLHLVLLWLHHRL